VTERQLVAQNDLLRYRKLCQQLEFERSRYYSVTDAVGPASSWPDSGVIPGTKRRALIQKVNSLHTATEDAILRALEQQPRIVERMYEIAQDMLEIERRIDTWVKDHDQQIALKWRYIECQSWEAIGQKLHMHRTTAKLKHDEGLEIYGEKILQNRQDPT
jgi:hypothetical protein